MMPYYDNTRVKRYPFYCLRDNKIYLNFKTQYNYLNTTNERILIRNCSIYDFRLINYKINENYFLILKTEKIKNQSLDKKIFNVSKLKRCEILSDGWSGENSKAINSNILSKAKYLIDILTIQPDIYPTPRGTIQFEYYKNSNYLEFEIFPTKTKMLKILKDEPYEQVISNFLDIEKEVVTFYDFRHD